MFGRAAADAGAAQASRTRGRILIMAAGQVTHSERCEIQDDEGFRVQMLVLRFLSIAVNQAGARIVGSQPSPRPFRNDLP